jgi:hypothetical protein
MTLRNWIKQAESDDDGSDGSCPRKHAHWARLRGRAVPDAFPAPSGTPPTPSETDSGRFWRHEV